MSVELIKYAFVAGELSPAYFGRGDLEKFDLGLALARNWFVDYRGGISTRPGQYFIDYVKDDDKDTRFFEFRFSPDVANTYVVLFGHNYIRFIQDGGYVLEAAKTITAVTQASPGVVTAAAHGFANGDWVKISGVVGMTELNNRTFRVAGVTANTFQLQSPFGVNLDTSGYAAYVSGGAVARIYTVTSPYASTDLADLQIKQIRDTLRITSPNFAVRNLVRNSATSWTLSLEDIGNDTTFPTGLSYTASGIAGGAGTSFVVTAVFADGTESPQSDVLLTSGHRNYATGSEAGDKINLTVSWNVVAGAVKYNVYRSSVIDDTNVTKGAQHGYIGNVVGTSFTDNNIIPDYTRAPPVYRNPFADGAIEHINITNVGSGYDRSTTTVAVAGGGGTGFRGIPIVNAAGAITAVQIINGGSGYSSPVVSFPAGGGTGATATVSELSASSGNNPAVSAVFQQRQIYAATDNDPLTVFGSQPGRFSNFDESAVLVDNDSYEHEIDAEQVAPIRHLVSMRGGLLVMSQTGIWQMSGGNVDNAVTPTNVLVDPQSFTGIAKLEPLKIDTDLLYKEGKGSIIRMLNYNEFSKVYAGKNISILSSHFFTSAKEVISWSYAADPYSIAWAVRSDGAMLAFTVVKEQDVYAWTQMWTKGLYKDVITIQEGTVDTTYFMVERYVAGRWTKFIERQAEREIPHVEEAFCVDCGLALGATYPNATLNADTVTGAVVFTTSAAVFTSGDVGKILRAGGGKARIDTFTSATEVGGTWLRAAEDTIPEDDSGQLVPQVSGAWTLDSTVTTLSGLWHLEGETVHILGDGHYFETAVVTNGAVTVPTGVSRAAVGFSYQCVAQSLPIIARDAVIEARRKRTVGVAARLRDTRGLKIGDELAHIYEMKERTTESYGEPTELQDGVKYLLIESDWNEHGQIYFVQDYPLPATVLGYVQDTEVGDDPN